MQSRCAGCGAPRAPGEICSWCGGQPSEASPRRCEGCGAFTEAPEGVCPKCLETLRAPRSHSTPADELPPPPAKPACRGCERLAESPTGLCAQCAKPQWQRRWEAFEAKVYAHVERHPFSFNVLVIGLFASPVVLALGVVYGGWFSEPEQLVVEPPFDYRYYVVASAPPSRTDPEVGLANGLKRGEVVVLTNGRVPGQRSEPVHVFPTRAALELVGQATTDRSTSDLRKALEAGFDVPDGTSARLLNPWPTRFYAEVRLLEGPLTGQTGWLPTTQIRR